jgi:hypothetical protein
VGGDKVQVPVRLEEDEAEALDRVVAKRQEEGREAGTSASRASVARGFIRAGLIAGGYLEAPALETAKPKGSKR